MCEAAHIAGIFVYPIKSTAAISVHEATIERRGLAGDRRWMVTDASGEFLSARELPELVKIRAELKKDGLDISAPGMPPISAPIPASSGARKTVTVWSDRCQGLQMGPEVDDWLSDYLKRPCRLVYMDDACIRPMGDRSTEAEVSFADNSPLLLIGNASLAHLNRQSPHPLNMRRFRPNLVSAGTQAYAEDAWGRVGIGEAEFEAVDRCDRCAVVNIDPDSAEKHPQQEPLRTLGRCRRGVDGGVYFGRYLVPTRTGTVRVGDPIALIE